MYTKKRCALLALAMCVLLPALAAAAGGAVTLPRTGQTSCYSATGSIVACSGTGQDGDLQKGAKWPSPRFIDNQDETITDNLTGRMWTKTANPDKTAKTWQQALDYVSTLNIGGYSDWRLPNVNELESLVNADAQSSAAWLTGQGFTNTKPAIYLSSTSTGNDAAYAWGVSLAGGSVSAVVKLGTYEAWPVRSGSAGTTQVPRTGQTSCYSETGSSIACSGTGQDGDIQAGVAWPSPRFIDHGDGTVTDSLTGLEWTMDANLASTTMTWQAALDYVKTLTTGGHGDWRLPNRKELRSLCDYMRDNPPLPLVHPFSGVQPDWYWSSTSAASNTNAVIAFSMVDGELTGLGKTSLYYVWPVRSGPEYDISTTTTTSVTSTTTTAMSTTTTAVTSTTTTTKCFLTKAMGDDDVKSLGVVRQFRDGVMARTEKGREYGALYYAHGQEISNILEGDPALKHRVTVMVLRALPMLRSIIGESGDTLVVLPQRLFKAMEAVAESIKAKAGPQLQQDINTVLAELQDKAVLQQFGVRKR